jgi:putative SOS response-associated peptidase YedK
MIARLKTRQRASDVRQQLEESHMPCEDCPADDEARMTYNFAPGNIGIVYRADLPDYGAGPRKGQHEEHDQVDKSEVKEESKEFDEQEEMAPCSQPSEVHYKLQAMKWGLIPSWTKRNPDYTSVMRTINCRDDSLIENRGMWNTMKRRKRCIVLCQGFYEWLKKNNGKEKIPHFVKRKDGQLMCMAGLWDCVKYEGMHVYIYSKRLLFLSCSYTIGSDEKTYTYTIITTDSNKQLNFLHDRMPVIFDNGSEKIRTWLDPNRYEWSNELQSLLKPFDGELEYYPVNRDVGKVGNSSPSFVIPIDSKENKSNIANFFANQKKAAVKPESERAVKRTEEEVLSKGDKIELDADGERGTTDSQASEHNAPLPSSPRGFKREHTSGEDDEDDHKLRKLSQEPLKSSMSPQKLGRKMKSATSNGTKSSPKKQTSGPPPGSQKITKFFGK